MKKLKSLTEIAAELKAEVNKTKYTKVGIYEVTDPTGTKVLSHKELYDLMPEEFPKKKNVIEDISEEDIPGLASGFIDAISRMKLDYLRNNNENHCHDERPGTIYDLIRKDIKDLINISLMQLGDTFRRSDKESLRDLANTMTSNFYDPNKEFKSREYIGSMKPRMEPINGTMHILVEVYLRDGNTKFTTPVKFMYDFDEYSRYNSVK